MDVSSLVNQTVFLVDAHARACACRKEVDVGRLQESVRVPISACMSSCRIFHLIHRIHGTIISGLGGLLY